MKNSARDKNELANIENRGDQMEEIIIDTEDRNLEMTQIGGLSIKKINK